jgi:hypothetical protein
VSLDERRDALALLGRELRDREARVEERERRALELDEREQRLVGEEHSARSTVEEVEARERLLREREDELHAREARLLADELGVRRRSEEVAAREALAEREGRAARPGAEAERCLLFVPGSGGYRLVSLDVRPPAEGESLEINGERFSVLRLGRSPLPGDARPCVYLAA